MYSLCDSPLRDRILRGRTGDEWPKDSCPDNDPESTVHHEEETEDTDVHDT